MAVLTSGRDAAGMSAAVRAVECDPEAVAAELRAAYEGGKAHAIVVVAEGGPGVLVGLLKGAVAATPLTDVVANRQGLDLGLLELANVLAK